MDLTAQYLYKPLPQGKNSIRLVRLIPNKDETAIIKCQLFNYSLEPDSHQYDALSYVWGNPNETLPIFIDESLMHITANLHAALLRLRDHSLERTIWIDAVCINQADKVEKKHQIQSMARIYGQANRVIVWLGGEEDDSNQALETIRSVAEDESTNVSNNWKAVLALLKRPWFERIWVLQEVAAARHVLIMCGSAKIDGYAFCLGLELLKGFYETREDLQGLIRSITYLIRGAIFRPIYAARRSGMDTLGICPLGELIDMYHTRKATEIRDKVYALLGMSSVDSSKASLLADYGVPWDKLLKRLVKLLLHEQVSVEAGPEKEMAVIRSTGCVFAQVSSVKSDITRDSRQNVNIISKIAPERLGYNGKYDPYWTLKVSAKQIQEGDIICLLQGVPTPVIVRPCKDYFAVIRIAAFPEDKPTQSGTIEWLKLLKSVTVFPRDFLLVWGWAEKWDLGEYESLIRTNDWMSEHSKTELDSQLDKATRMWNFALILEDLGEYKGTEERLREAIEGYEVALGEKHPHTLNDLYNRTPLSLAAWNWYGAVVNAQTSLWLAIRGGHKTVVKLLLGTGKADVNSRDKNGRTPLSWAAEEGHLTVVERLLQEKAEVNATAVAYSGRTALQAAAEGGHLAIVERLLQEKADINAAGADNSGKTALQAAAGGGHLHVVERLLQEKTEVNAAAPYNYGRTALQAAAEGGHLDVVERLLQEKAEINAAAATGDSGRTALQAAAGGGHLAIVERLLQEKADVNAAAEFGHGRTALQAAAEGGHLDVVERLLQENAEVNASAAGYGGRTALQAAAGGGHLDVVERLLQENAEVNAVAAPYYYGRTALQAAAEGGHLAIVERLLQEKAEVNAAAALYHYGRTALQAAAEGGHLAVIERLLQEKAEVNAIAVENSGRTALQAAAEGGHLATVEWLLQENAEVNAASASDSGRTALQAAAGGGYLAVVERLLQEKADVNAIAVKNSGRTALQAAAEGGYLAVVERLLQEKADVNAVAAQDGGRTALQAAAKGGHLAVVERLLQEKAEVNAAAPGYSGRTALQAAAEGGHLTIVERLLQEKAEVNSAAFSSTKTALQAAAEGGHLAIVERLLQEKAEVNAAAPYNYGRTALQAAAEGGHLSVVERLLQEKADVNAAGAGNSGRTALQAAAEGGHLAIVERLLQEKVEVNAAAASHSGRTALQAAVKGGHLAVAECLRSAGAIY